VGRGIITHKCLTVLDRQWRIVLVFRNLTIMGSPYPPRKNHLDQCSQLSGAPVGPHAVTSKSPGRDGTTKRSPFLSGKPQDGGPCNVTQISLGDCRVKFFASFNNFLCQTEVGTCVKDNKRSVLFYSNHLREWTLIE